VKADAVLCIFGWLLAGMSLAMFVPAFGALIGNDIEHSLVFFNSAAICGFFAGLLIISLRGKENELTKRGSLLLVLIVWTILPVFAAVPIYFSGVIFSPGKALFEAVSGFTTSGATVLTHLDRQPVAILLWRALLQWLGGLYTVIAAGGIFVMLGIGGMQMQYVSMPHGDGQSLFGRLRQVARALLGVYSLLTLFCFLSYWAAGMPIFDAFCHALSTVSTGGFSTRDASIGAFNSPLIEMVAVIFMTLGAMNLALHWAAANGRWRGYALDPEARYLGAAILATVAGVAAILLASDFKSGVGPLHWALFNGVSFLTTSGFWTGNLAGVPPVAAVILLAAVLVGGATGSTSGGFKQMRVGLVIRQGWLELARLISPNEVLTMRYGAAGVKQSQIAAVWVVFVGLSFVLILAIVLIGLTGPNFEQSVSIAISAISNSGPAAALFYDGAVSPYASMSEATRAVAMAGMIAGRMEVLTLLTLLSPAYWRG